MQSARLPTESDLASVQERQRRTFGAPRPNALAALIPPRIGEVAQSGFWDGARGLYPAPIDRPTLARNALIQRALGCLQPIPVTSLHQPARLEGLVHQGWGRFAGGVDVSQTQATAQSLVHRVYNTQGIALWLRELVQVHPACRPVVERFCRTRINLSECLSAVADYLDKIWKAANGDHPVCKCFDVLFDVDRYREFDGHILIRCDFEALSLSALCRYRPELQAKLRSALVSLDKFLRQVGLPNDYASYFEGWREDEFYEVEQLTDYLLQAGEDPSNDEAVGNVIALVEDGALDFSLHYIDSVEHFRYLESQNQAFLVIGEHWSDEAIQAGRESVLDAQTPDEAALLAWCERVDSAIRSSPRKITDFCEPNGFGLFTPLLLPEMRELEDDLQMFFEGTMNGDCEDDYGILLSPEISLSDIGELIQKMTTGNRLLAELYDLSESIA